MRIDTPPIRRLARSLGRPAPLLTLAILLASPVVLARPGSTADDMARQAAIVAGMEQVPLRIGSWVGSPTEIPTDQTEILNPNALLSREYSAIGERGVGTRVILFLAHCSDVRDMDGHWPLHCYPRSGWKVEDYRDNIQVEAPDGLKHNFAWARFTIANNTATLRSKTVFFTFILPDGRVETDMRELSSRSARRSISSKGVAQFQLVFDGDVPPERCAVVAQELLNGVPASLRAFLGMPTRGPNEQPTSAATTSNQSATKDATAPTSAHSGEPGDA